MNKYQEALDYLRRIGGDGYYKKQREKSFDVLQELVDKYYETEEKLTALRQEVEHCRQEIEELRLENARLEALVDARLAEDDWFKCVGTK